MGFPLVIAAAAFLVVLLWRVRPQLGWGPDSGAIRQSLRDAKARVEAATTDPDRAIALCEAAELLAPGSAQGYYLRAVRAAPASTEVIARVVAGLGKRPRLLESVLWRHLASTPWTDARDAALASLTALVALYDGPLRDPTSARALRHATDTLERTRALV
jgi:hypothetical protein